jgi:hypothetical protein
MTITIDKQGRRHYLIGDTYSVRNQLRDAGCHWDGDRKAWWTGDAATAQNLVGHTNRSNGNGERLNDNDKIEGRAKYKGRSYILVWSGQTKRGTAAKLAFMDGSKVFWADLAEVEVTKRYSPRKSGYGRYAREEYMTFGRLRELQEDWKRKTPEEREDDQRAAAAGGRCRCAQPLDEGDGECMYCGYAIVG